MAGSSTSLGVRSYALVTAGYWAFTVTDGAMRMLVLLHFHDLGYSPVAIAFLFLLYEFMGIVTNLVGGWVGSQHGLHRTLVGGLSLQVAALLLLSLSSASWPEWISVAFVMGVQALSGVAKDLTKMSSKSAVKFVAGEGSLFRWVAALTGSKNALKGVGFFVGAALLGSVGYRSALVILAGLVAAALAGVLALLREDIGRSGQVQSLRSTLAKPAAINRLAAARFFLFGSRDIWFVVALPVFLDEVLGWSYEGIGAFLAAWIIGYGLVQSVAPPLIRLTGDEARGARVWIVVLAIVSAAIAIAIAQDIAVEALVVVGLIAFGLVFAVNSSLHSYLILAYSGDDVATDVGFYYSANAAGRLAGTLLSGVLYLWGGFDAALWGSTAFVLAAAAFTYRLPTP